MTTFIAMTWNVENLFRPGADAPRADRDRYQQKLQLLAGVVAAQDPDVLALQEIGGEQPLQDLQDALGGTHPHRVASPFPDGRGIRVGFLSKHSIGDRDDIVDFPQGPALGISDLGPQGTSVPITRMGRGALFIRVTKGNLTVDLITAHLKSKLLSYPAAPGRRSQFSPLNEDERAQAAGIALHRRGAEAVALRMRANGLLVANSNARLIVLGDFNDVPEAQTSLLLCGPEGSEIGTGGFNRADLGDDARLFNLAPIIQDPGLRFSRIHRGRKELLDQILASEECLPVGGDGRRKLPLFASHTDFAGQLASVTEEPSERRAELAPDHAPVTAQFDL